LLVVSTVQCLNHIYFSLIEEMGKQGEWLV
jgi:hypothetical protein